MSMTSTALPVPRPRLGEWPLGLLILACVTVSLLTCAGRASGEQSFPRLANIYFPPLGAADLDALARWDLLVLPSRAQDWSQAELAGLRARNPEILLVAHTPVGYGNDWFEPPVCGDVTRKLYAEGWWLCDTRGEIVRLPWFGDGLLNQTIWCPPDSSGDLLCDWLGEFIAERLPPGSLWDGVFLDCCWDDVSWLNNYIPYPIDANGDGIAESNEELDAGWRSGMERLASRLRELAGPDYIVVTNGNNTLYEQCNGSTRENFPNMHGSWYDNIANPEYGYVAIMSRYRDPATSILNAIWEGAVDGDGEPVRTPQFERKVRFTLTSALVYGDGYYSLDGGDGLPSHSQVWWHELYDEDLGSPLGRAELAPSDYGSWVYWGDLIKLRRFERGVAVVNPTSCTQTVDLGGVYYRRGSWNGTFYPWTEATTTVMIPAQDGEILRGGGTALEGAPRFLYGAFSERGVVLSWSAVPGASWYSVYRSLRPGGSTYQENLIALVEETQYFDATAGGSPEYHYTVAPIDQSSCEGRPSEPIAVYVSGGVAPPPAPPAGGGAPSVLPHDGEAAEPVASPVLAAHPNPSRGSTTLSYCVGALPAGDRISLRIYDVGGRLVRTLAVDRGGEGRGEAVWDGLSDDGARVPTGCYLTVLMAGSRTSTSKVVVIR